MKTGRRLARKLDWNNFRINILLKVNEICVKDAERSLKKALKLQGENRGYIKQLADYYVKMDATEQRFEDLRKDLGL